MFETSLEISENYYGKQHIKTANTINSLGIIYKDLGELKSAEEMYEISLKITENHYGKQHIKTVN